MCIIRKGGLMRKRACHPTALAEEQGEHAGEMGVGGANPGREHGTGELERRGSDGVEDVPAAPEASQAASPRAHVS